MQEKTPPTQSSGRKKYIGLVPRYLLPPFSCYVDVCETGLDVDALIRELAITRVEHGSEIPSDVSRYLAAEVVRLGSLLFCSRYFHSARAVLSSDRKWR